MSMYLQYLYINNEYGWAMTKDLPTHGFSWKKGEDFTSEKRQERISFRD